MRPSEPAIREAQQLPAATLPIAIVGMACRFPGANDARELWRLLTEGRDAIVRGPEERFRRGLFRRTDGDVGKYCGVVEGIDRFDHRFFSMTPREALVTDPQVRLLLEVTMEALEDAGIVTTALADRRVGVFVGISNSDYREYLRLSGAELDVFGQVGVSRSAAAGRVSYHFDFHGPSVTYDAEAASSLVALEQACESLSRGEVSLAVVGGTNVVLAPGPGIAWERVNLLAPDGLCKFADFQANGIVRSDGIGVVILKPLSTAQQDGDPIYAVIHGIASVPGCLSLSSMAGAVERQRALLLEAWRRAGVAPSDVAYIEAHGIGVPAVDDAELRAVSASRQGEGDERACYVGSLKTNLGHMEGAAGVGSLIKAALVVRHRTIPASLHFTRFPRALEGRLHPSIRVPSSMIGWPHVGAAYVGVSAFGLGGLGVHAVLGEPPAPAIAITPRSQDEVARAHLLPISAHSRRALRKTVERYINHLTNEPQTAPLAKLCVAAQQHREHRSERTAVVATSSTQVRRKLEELLAGLEQPVDQPRARGESMPRLAFVCPGQGSQWVAMGAELMRTEPRFSKVIEECATRIAPHVDWSLTDVLCNQDDRWLQRVDIVQPALVAMQIALAALWRSWGIEPDAVVGISMGEIAAAHIVGAVSLDDAMRIIAERSRLIIEWARGKGSDRGAMAAVGMPEDEIVALLSELGLGAVISPAVLLSPEQTVVAGNEEALTRLLGHLQEKSIFARWVKVDYASHSHYMEPVLEELRHRIGTLRLSSPAVPLYSTVNAAVANGIDLGADYWARNLRQPVRFAETIPKLLADGVRTFLEVSPHGIALEAVFVCSQHAGVSAVALPSLTRDHASQEGLLASAAKLYELGYDLRWSQLGCETLDPEEKVELPTTAWDHDRHWLDDVVDASETAEQQPDPARVRLLLRRKLGTAGSDEEYRSILSAYLCEQLARTLHLEQGIAIGSLSIPLDQIGLESLTGAELAARIHTELGVSVMAPELLRTSIDALAALLASRMTDVHRFG